MALKLRSLGSCTAVERGMEITAATNASPIVVTTDINSRLKDDERVAIWGITGNTHANGFWSVKAAEYSTYTFELEGSSGNGAATMTNAVIACLFDDTPFMKGHSAVVHVGDQVDGVAADLTFNIMGVNDDLAAGLDSTILNSNEGDLATYFEAVNLGQPWPVPGPTNDGINELREIKLRRLMYLDCTARTAGGISANVIA